ncbi:hypothetical protein LCGC14_2966860, partial [marine sediment metagenome]
MSDEKQDCLYWTPIHKCNYFNEALNTNNLNCKECKVEGFEDDKEWLKGTPLSKWIKRLEELEQKLDAGSARQTERLNLHSETMVKMHNNLSERIEALEKSLEPKLKLNYMLKMNQLEKNDKTHQALYGKLFKDISELNKKHRESEFLQIEINKEFEDKITELKEQKEENWTFICNHMNLIKDNIERIGKVINGNREV